MTIKFDADGYALSSGNIIIYNVTQDTEEYVGSSCEFINVGQGLPALSYIDEPMEAKKGFAICRTTDKKSWEYIADHRGETRYSTISKEKIIIKEIGEYPINTTDIAPADFEKWDGGRWIVDEEAKLSAEIESANIKKSKLKINADSEISWRQDAVDGAYAEANEVTELAGWKRYRVLLMRIDTSKAPDIEWPVSPE